MVNNTLYAKYQNWLRLNPYRDLHLELDIQWFQKNNLSFNSNDRYLNFYKGMIYFIRFSGSWSKALIKIGFTSKIDRRFSQLDKKYSYLISNTTSIINIIDCQYPYIAEQAFIKRLGQYKSTSDVHNDKEIFLVDWQILKYLRRLESIKTPPPWEVPQYTPKSWFDDIPF